MNKPNEGIKNKQTLEDFINLIKDLACESDINTLLATIIKESIIITQAQGGKIYLPDITKKYFDLKHICLAFENESDNYEGNKKFDFEEIIYHSNNQPGQLQVSRVGLQNKGMINSTNYLIYSAITGKLLELNKQDNFSSYQVDQILQYDTAFSCQTRSVLVMPLCDHEGITIGLLELYNYCSEYDQKLLNEFTSLSAVLINNTNLVTHNKYLISLLDENNRALEDENNRLKKSIEKEQDYAIIGKSPAMKAVFSLLDKVADSNVTVLLRGETGTGKEVFAHAIHNTSLRKSQPLVCQNCAALPEDLLESELFGHKKGAFTGAHQDKAGLFDQANGGALFLDEIGDMPINLQAKVLRVIQEQEVRPLGANNSHKVNVRLIAATNCDLEEKIVKGEFRQDLFYRLNVFPVTLPKLCERENDVLLLINYFLDYYCEIYQRTIKTIAPNVIDILTRYPYPGNVRELQNIMERAVLLCNDQGILLTEHLPVEVVNRVSSHNNEQPRKENNICKFPLKSLKSVVQTYEASVIKDNLRANDWNQTLTAQILKLPRRTLVEKISRLNIVIPK
ncbi:MAG: sigma-54 dependent transcriptional regulator [Gammaproteobacteria bacterium]|nr:sigma-54 dependent transcriptional regulator [Gammaproteobacteria bacterium]